VEPGAPECQEIRRIARRRRHIGRSFDTARRVRDLDVPNDDISPPEDWARVFEERIGLRLIEDEIANEQDTDLV
jgi:hypothetical protein